MELIELRAGEARLELAPALGGGIASWSVADGPVMRPRADEVLSTRYVRGLAAYPMVPFSNRIAQGRFSWAGHAYQLPAIFNGHALHGVGWERPWSIGELSGSAASLTLEYAAGPDWPFAFSAEQHFALTGTALEVSMSVTNRARVATPAGLGLHPYFPRGDRCVMQFEAEAVWLCRPDLIPTERVAVPAAWDHAAGRKVGEPVLDQCFDGWSGTASLHWPDRGMTLTLTADPVFSRLVVFTPKGRDFLAVEPATNVNDGINREGGGMVTLEPDETLNGTMRFALS